MLKHKYAEKQRTIDPERGRSMSVVVHKDCWGRFSGSAQISVHRRPGRSRHAMPEAMETTIDAQTIWLPESRHLGEVREFGMLGR